MDCRPCSAVFRVVCIRVHRGAMTRSSFTACSFTIAMLANVLPVSGKKRTAYHMNTTILKVDSGSGTFLRNNSENVMTPDVHSANLLSHSNTTDEQLYGDNDPVHGTQLETRQANERAHCIKHFFSRGCFDSTSWRVPARGGVIRENMLQCGSNSSVNSSNLSQHSGMRLRATTKDHGIIFDRPVVHLNSTQRHSAHERHHQRNSSSCNSAFASFWSELHSLPNKYRCNCSRNMSTKRIEVAVLITGELRFKNEPHLDNFLLLCNGNISLNFMTLIPNLLE